MKKEKKKKKLKEKYSINSLDYEKIWKLSKKNWNYFKKIAGKNGEDFGKTKITLPIKSRMMNEKEE